MNQALPNIRRFLERFHVDLSHGTSWLDDQRVLVLQAEWYFDLREHLISMLGQNEARSMLFEIGRAAGVRDALTAIKLSPNASFEELISTGGEFHAFQGAGRSKALSRKWDPGAKYLRAEFNWENSIEAELCAHSRHKITGGACWMYTGHASGFISTIAGGDVEVKEVACIAHGAPECHCIAQFSHQWAEQSKAQTNADASLHLPGNVETPESSGEPLQGEAGPAAEGLIGHSAAFRFTLRSARRVGRTGASVLLLGESGVGKSTIARFIHECSTRSGQAFLEINCATIPEALLEAELFGVERGAFTGADATRVGRFEEANGGTLFLDEVGLLTPAAQGKLLRVLQNQQYERLGSSKTRHADVRVIAATNDNMADAVARGTFRADLFYRLNVFPIVVPALRSRRGDLPILMNVLLKQLAGRYGCGEIAVSPEAYRALLHHDWPGNIRELENVLERAVILKEPDEAIELHHIYIGEAGKGQTGLHWLSQDGTLSSDVDGNDEWVDLALNGSGRSLEEVEKRVFIKACGRADGNILAVCEMLDLTRAQVDYRLRKWGLDAKAFRKSMPS